MSTTSDVTVDDKVVTITTSSFQQCFRHHSGCCHFYLIYAIHWSYSVAISEYWGLPVCLSPEAFVRLSLPPCMSGLTPGPHFAHLGPSLPHRSSSRVCRLRLHWLWCCGGDKLLQSSHCCCQLIFENYLNHWKLGLTRMPSLSSLVVLEAVTMTTAVPTSDVKVALETTFAFTDDTVHPENQAHSSPLH